MSKVKALIVKHHNTGLIILAVIVFIALLALVAVKIIKAQKDKKTLEDIGKGAGGGTGSGNASGSGGGSGGTGSVYDNPGVQGSTGATGYYNTGTTGAAGINTGGGSGNTNIGAPATGDGSVWKGNDYWPLTVGSQGDRVLALQKYINQKAKFKAVPEDGYFTHSDYMNVNYIFGTKYYPVTAGNFVDIASLAKK